MHFEASRRKMARGPNLNENNRFTVFVTSPGETARCCPCTARWWAWQPRATRGGARLGFLVFLCAQVNYVCFVWCNTKPDATSERAERTRSETGACYIVFLIKIINAPKNTKGGGGVCSLQASPLAVAAALVDTAPRFALLTILWKRTVADMRAPLAPSRQTPLALLVVTRDIDV